jgi:hypothetical protein
MDMVTLGPLIERLGSFALIVWLMIWGATRIANRMDTTQTTLARVTDSLIQSNSLQERSLKLIERLEVRMDQMEGRKP